MKKQTKTIKKHEQEYIHIPKPNMKKIGSFFLGLFLFSLSYFNLKLIILRRLSTDIRLSYSLKFPVAEWNCFEPPLCKIKQRLK